MVKSLGNIFEILRDFQGLAGTIIFLNIATALLESIGIGMLLPAMEIAMGNGSQSTFGQWLSPLTRHFSPHYHLVVILGAILLVTLVKVILKIFLAKAEGTLRAEANTHWMEIVLRYYLGEDYAAFTGKKHGVMFNDIFNETAKARQTLSQVIEFLSKLCLTLSVLAVLFISSWQVTLLSLVFLSALFLCTHGISRRFSEQVGCQRLQLHQELYALGSETLSGMRQIRTFGMEPMQMGAFQKLLKKYTREEIKNDIVCSLPLSVGELLVVALLVASVLYFHYFLQISMQTLVPILGIFIVALRPLISNLSSMARVRMEILAGLPSVEHVLALVKKAPVSLPSAQISVAPVRSGEITFKNVTFGYPSKEILFRNLNFTVPRGEVTAIIGSSGVGKSSLLDLIVRLYEPASGEILLNGKDIHSFSLADWRQQIGFVSQDTFLFNASIRENIRMSNPRATDSAVEDAARFAHAHDFIMSLPMQYDTLVGERGFSLSGGQRQRIAIARSVLRQCAIYIFDEATSALDPQTEDLICRSIDGLKKLQNTVLVVSHRSSLIKNADTIYELKEEGKLFLSTPTRQAPEIRESLSL